MAEVREHRRRVTLAGAVEMVDLVVGAHNRVVVEPPTVWRPETAPLAAAPGSGLMLPGPWNAFTHPVPSLLGALHQALALGNGRILVIGHDDAQARVGQARADFVLHLLAENREAWVALATTHGSLLDIHGYLASLDAARGWSCGITAVDGLDNEASANTIAGFQREFIERHERPISVDGVCGPETLGAVFDVLFADLTGWLNKHGLSLQTAQEADIRYLAAAYGCWTRRGFDGAPGAALDLLVGSPDWMDAEEVTAVALYGSQVLIARPLRVPREDGWETGPYTLITDVTAGEQITQERYILRSTDDRYEQQLLLPDNAVDTGLLELHYDGLPTDARFDLRVEIEGVGVFPLFNDVSYPDLHRQATGEIPSHRA